MKIDVKDKIIYLLQITSIFLAVVLFVIYIIVSGLINAIPGSDQILFWRVLFVIYASSGCFAGYYEVSEDQPRTKFINQQKSMLPNQHDIILVPDDISD